MSATASTEAASRAPAAPASADSQERRELLELAAEIARHELMPAAPRLDRSEEEAIAACWQTICEVGLDRAFVSEEAGGAGIGERDLLAAVEELAVGDGGTALAVLLSNVALASLRCTRAAAVPAAQRWAAVPVGWGARVAFAGDRLAEVRVPALGAHGADGLALLFPPGPLHDGGRCSVLHLAGSTPELHRRRDEHQLGLGGAPAASVTLIAGDGEAGGPAQRDGSGEGSLQESSPLGLLRLGAAAVARGIARRAEQIAGEYAHARSQGGVAIVEHDAVRDMLGAMAVRRLSLPAAGELTGAEADADARAIAERIAASEAALATATDAVQIFGGTGYMRPTGAEKLMRDAKCIAMFPEPGWVAQDMLIPTAG